MHLTADQLADLADGTLAPAELTPLRAHVAACSTCAADLAALDRAVGALGTALPAAEPMPADVAQRLDAAIAAEAEQRASDRTEQATRQRQRAHEERLSTGSFANPPTRRRTGIDIPA